MFRWMTREAPVRLRPAKGIINGLIIVALILLIAPGCFGAEDGDSPDSTSQTTVSVNPGQSPNNWTSLDTAREAAWLALHVTDWGQTLEIARNPRDYREMNPVLGDYPSVGNVNLYMGAWAVVHPVVSYLLPRGWRETWQYVTIGVSAVAISNNFNLGLKVRF